MASDPSASSSSRERLAPYPLVPTAPLPVLHKTPLAPMPREERPLRPSRAYSAVLTGLLLLFAFFVSSTAVRNSDFWRRLATGRLLAQGEYRFGVDPFTYTSAGEYWVNHAWLFD